MAFFKKKAQEDFSYEKLDAIVYTVSGFRNGLKDIVNRNDGQFVKISGNWVILIPADNAKNFEIELEN